MSKVLGIIILRHFLTQWKVGEVIKILKPGKPAKHLKRFLNSTGGSEVLIGAKNGPSVEEVALAIKSLKSGKSVGVDEIWLKMLKVLEE